MGIIPKSEVRQIQLKGDNFQCGPVQQIYTTLLQHSTKVLNKQERKDSPVWLKEMSSITLHTICRTMLLAMKRRTTAEIQTSTVCCLGPSLPHSTQMHSFAWSLSLWLSLKSRSFQHAADNHTYSMCRQPINLSHCFIFQSFINHTASRMANSLLYNILN